MNHLKFRSLTQWIHIPHPVKRPLKNEWIFRQASRFYLEYLNAGIDLTALRLPGPVRNKVRLKSPKTFGQILSILLQPVAGFDRVKTPFFLAQTQVDPIGIEPTTSTMPL
jgi:hypothetical protein